MVRLGVAEGEASRRGVEFVTKFILSGGDKTRLEEEVRAVVADPASFLKILCAAPSPRL